MSSLLKVVTHNIHKGRSFGNRNWVLSDIKQDLIEFAPDILLLQEVKGDGDLDIPSQNQIEFLADQHWNYASYGKNASTLEGHHGNAILSKFPIIKERNWDISENPFARRGILYNQIELTPKSEFIHLYCTHFDLLEGDRIKQVHAITKLINERHHPSDKIILAGDFNDGLKTIGSMLERNLSLKDVFMETSGRYLPTFPSFYPFLCLDRVLYRGLDVISCEVRRPRDFMRYSDHAAVSVTFNIQYQT